MSASCSMVYWCSKPVKRPSEVDMVIFRENTEDIYAGIEYQAGSDKAKAVSNSYRRNGC